MTEAITVSKLNTYIKQVFDAEELLRNIPVIGEVFGLSISRNVIYFSLKDEEASLPCVCFYPALANELKEGDKLVVVGSPNFYVKGGKLNFNVVKIEKVGLGKLYEDFLKLKQKLESEGLFDNSHKIPMPPDIKRIGVITSRDGAVIQDIKNVAWRRNPNIDIVLFNTKVQGNFAENEIAHAIELLGNYDDIDVIVVARGGGSLEDLAPYNTEMVARATYACPKPIVSAVGHETDYTILDFVSDLRAPTPSAAAELLTFNLEARKQELNSLKSRFLSSSERYLAEHYKKIDNLSLMINGHMNNILTKEYSVLEQKKLQLLNGFEKSLNQRYYELGMIENTLNKINPKHILNKGYARVEQNGKSIQAKIDLDKSELLQIIFKDGKVSAEIKGE
ncbi:MAG: exodeoxyribonuclease VII large subunit [Clostridiales bacterium]|nr:exodeoxyribonuclease VII large subunit [Clostridiales bacterium]